MRNLGGGSLQAALDAETLLDEDLDGRFFGWSDEQRYIAECLRSEYLQWVQRQVGGTDKQHLVGVDDERIGDEIADALSELNEVDGLIVLLRFGLTDGRKWSYEEIGKYMNLPVTEVQARVSLILGQLSIDAGAVGLRPAS